MNLITLIFLFIFGAVFGSFGSVLLWRLKDGFNTKTMQGILTGRSECPGCHNTLTVSQLIPLWGRVRQQGKCFRCHRKISSMYPVLELVSGIIFVLRGIFSQLSILNFEFGMSSLLLLVIRWLLGLILVRDMYTYELHMPLFGILAILGISELVLGYMVDGISFIQPLWYASIFLIVFLGIYYFGKRYSKVRFCISQEAFGSGDVLLAPILGLLLGLHYTGSSQAIGEIVLYFVLGSCLVGLAYYALVSMIFYLFPKTDLPDSNHEMNTPMIPFFPAMIVCYLIMVLS